MLLLSMLAAVVMLWVKGSGDGDGVSSTIANGGDGSGDSGGFDPGIGGALGDDCCGNGGGTECCFYFVLFFTR